MTIHLKQSTAVTVKLGPFVDDTDGKTAETALTLSQADFRLSKNGGDFAQKNDATSGTHDEIGYYDVPLNTTDTNTLGTLRVAVHESGALPVWQDFMVLPANVWDSLYGSDKLQVDAVEISGDSTAADNLEAAADGTGYNLGGGSVVAVSVTADSVHTGTAQAGGSATVTLAAGASATNDIYNYQRIDITSGTGAGQSAIVTDYDGTTKVATVDHAWQTTPDNTSVYRVVYARVPRDVSKVTGDVEGKILGTTSGGGTMSGAGVWAYDHTGAAISGGGSSDWTADEKTAIKTILGVPASGTTPDAPSAGALKVIDDFLDTEVTAIKAKTDNLPASPAATGDAMTLADGAITSAKFASGAIDAAAIATDAFGSLELAAGAATEIAAAVVDQAVSGHTTSGTFGEAISNASANSTTILSRIGSFTGSGVNTILGFFKALMSKTASTPSDVGGTFSAATDSTEAIRDRGDAAWTSGAGYEVRAAINPDDAGNVLVSAFLTLNGVKVALASGSCEVICRETTAGVDAWTATSSTVVDGFYFNVSHVLAAPANGENYLFKITVTDASAVEYETVIPLPAV